MHYIANVVKAGPIGKGGYYSPNVSHFTLWQLRTLSLGLSTCPVESAMPPGAKSPSAPVFPRCADPAEQLGLILSIPPYQPQYAAIGDSFLGGESQGFRRERPRYPRREGNKQSFSAET